MNFYITPTYIKDKQQFEQITKQLGWMRGSSDVLRYLHAARESHLCTVALLSVKTPNIIYKMSQMAKQMPAQGTQTLRMRRYDT